MATYQSLYRRYRSQRFDEVLGQDHITRALRNAVREGRVGHAYLFSGPRGTGKTSTARILAKVLNCAAPVDGEPCGQCESCVAVAEGRVTDWLLEQDAASKSKVDDMRDLLERVPLGTSGNRKVIILDEVHMLSQGAENALLKTLEEPPEHVVFVLATTDPQKVRPTIKSRTQHFEFKLLPPDVMTEHVRRVIADAGLDLGEDAVDYVVRVGGGSARDTLSALDQVAALGEVADDGQPVDAAVDALCDRDAGAVLVAVADALASGRDPRSLGEAVIAALRDAFLSVMGVGDTHLAPAVRARAAEVGARLGAPGLTRALEVLGEALVELARKPDPRIVVEVALVRLTRADTDRTLDAVLERLDRLERAVAGGAPAGRAGGTAPAGSAAAGGSGSPAGEAPVPPPTLAAAVPAASAPGGEPPPPAPSAPLAAPGAPEGGSAASARAVLAARRAGDDRSPAAAPAPAAPAPAPAAAPGRPTLGAVARRQTGARPAPEPGPAVTADGAAGATTAAAPPPPAPAPSPEPAEAAAPSGSTAMPALDQVTAAWTDHVLAGLPIPVRSKWRAGRWLDVDGGAVRFAVDNEWHQRVCEDTRREVEQALASHLGTPVTVRVVVDGAAGPAQAAGGAGEAAARRSPGGGPAGGDGEPDPGEDEHIDPSELRDAGDVATGGVDLLLREFGGELVEEER